MMRRVISQMAPLAQGSEIAVCAIFRLVIKMRCGQNDERICNRVAFAMHGAAGLTAGDPFTCISRTLLDPLANLTPVRWVPLAFTRPNRHVFMAPQIQMPRQELRAIHPRAGGR